MAKLKISQNELDILRLPQRISALDITKMIRLPIRSNVLNYVDLSLTPYLKLPIQLIGRNQIEWIFMIAPTQSGKTVFLQVVVADTIYQDPGTLLYILPDETSGKKAVKEKLIEMIINTPELKQFIPRRYKAVNVEQIRLNNMVIYPAWAGSLATLSSTPAKRVILDEVRLMKLQIGDESNAIKLANDRLTTYKYMGLGQGYAVSTPSTEGDLLHQQLTVPGTMIAKWHVKCMNCGKVQVLDFFLNMTKKGTCICIACGFEFSDKDQKKVMNSNGFYATDESLEPLQINSRYPKRVIFWYDSLVSPFRSFSAIWDEFIATKDKLHDYKNFYQCWLARFWIDDISKTSIEELTAKVCNDEVGVVPSWCKVLTAGIDSQDKGFYVVVRAWGSNRKTRVIDAFFIECNVSITTDEEVKLLFTRDIQERIFTTLDGDKWQIGLYAIDTGGHRTKQIYAAAHGLERIILVKGKDTQNTTIRYSPDYNLYLVRTIEYLEESDIKSLSQFSEIAKGITLDYFHQFINVRKTRKRNKWTGEEKIIWKRVGQFDYRMADVHSFICLDIPTSVGTFRRELEKDDFFNNPIVRRIEEKARRHLVEQNELDEETDAETVIHDYNIGSFSEGW